MTEQENFEVIIVGGSYAGQSAALALGRSLRQTLIIDSQSPCNRQTPHSHNFLTQDGKAPKEISSLAKQQLEQYDTIQFHHDFAIEGKRVEGGFEITTQSGKSFTGKKVVFATGVKDIMPAIKGFSACWGISVIHCPYCHGYEYRHQKTGIMANGEHAFHLATLVKNLTDSITILTRGKAEFTDEQLQKFKQHNIQVIETEISEIEHQNGYIEQLVFEDGSSLAFDAVYANIPFNQHSEIPATLGCELTDLGHIKVDDFQKTNVDGVFACGDNANYFRSVAKAVASGNSAGAVVNMELTQEEF